MSSTSAMLLPLYLTASVAAALAFGVNRVERQRRFAAAADAREDDELVARDGHVNVFEVVLLRAADRNVFGFHVDFLDGKRRESLPSELRYWNACSVCIVLLPEAAVNAQNRKTERASTFQQLRRVSYTGGASPHSYSQRHVHQRVAFPVGLMCHRPNDDDGLVLSGRLTQQA
jgi:hypothetical protein